MENTITEAQAKLDADRLAKVQATWRFSKTSERRCNVMSRPWQAMAGCLGTGKAWKYGIVYMGRQEVTSACEPCRAMSDRIDSLRGDARQAYMTQVQADAGVADYRTVRVRMVAGRPTIVRDAAATERKT